MRNARPGGCLDWLRDMRLHLFAAIAVVFFDKRSTISGTATAGFRVAFFHLKLESASAGGHMLFSHKARKFLAALGILLWAHIDACMAFAAFQTASFKLAPRSYSARTASAAPDADVAASLFDHNAESTYAPAEPALVDVSLDKAQVISEFRILGSSSYLLSAQAQVNGQWQDAAPLKNLRLDSFGSQWHRHPLKKPVATKAIRLQLIPAADAAASEGIREIELWSPGQQEPVSV